MIRYLCPRCNKALLAQDQEVGVKLHCPHCGQRVQVPAPSPPNKTMLGKVDDQSKKTVLGTLENAANPSPSRRLADEMAAPPVPRTILVESVALPDALPELEEIRRPSARLQGRSREQDENIDRPRRRTFQECPRCGCADYPRQVTKFAGASIALLIVGIFFWPLIIVAFLVQEKWDVCAECGEKLRQTGTGF